MSHIKLYVSYKIICNIELYVCAFFWEKICFHQLLRGVWGPLQEFKTNGLIL